MLGLCLFPVAARKLGSLRHLCSQSLMSWKCVHFFATWYGGLQPRSSTESRVACEGSQLWAVTETALFLPEFTSWAGLLRSAVGRLRQNCRSSEAGSGGEVSEGPGAGARCSRPAQSCRHHGRGSLHAASWLALGFFHSPLCKAINSFLPKPATLHTSSWLCAQRICVGL